MDIGYRLQNSNGEYETELIELFPFTILRKAKLNYTPYTCCLLVVVGNKRYFLESEVCRGHLTRKQHCNLDSERGA